MPKHMQYLSKRRKNQLLKRTLNNTDRYSAPLHSFILNVAPNRQVEVPNILTEPITSFESNISLEYEKYNDRLSEEFHVCSQNSAEEDSGSENRIAFIYNDKENESNLREDLRKLIIESNMTHGTANLLLKVLRKHGCVELPNDVRVLVSTPRNACGNIQRMSNGHYVHFGLLFGLEQCIIKYCKFIKNREIKISINIDGLPLSKSSGSQFWPIMASTEDIDIYTLPFLIGVFHGMNKPKDANEFLTNFVNECMFLTKNGITVNNKTYVISIKAILCDAPAKAFITYTKGHTGYFSCSKCTQEGDFIQNRVTFPEINNILRTDDSFKNRTQIEHHIGDSILENLSIGMISHFPLDYMHLVCLGVMKRLIQLWVRGNKSIRLSCVGINSISQDLISMKHSITFEFARKPRSLCDVDRWKATEFRQFLLYTGMVVLKTKIPLLYYNHFLSLSIAIRIMADKQLCKTFNAYANSLLQWFVSNFGAIYGDEYLSHNVHNLLHLSNDVQKHGCLDNFSCFKYENYMQKIKKKLHQCGKPLQELSNRIFEESKCPMTPCYEIQYPVVIYARNKISYVQYENFKIAANEIDNCCLLEDNTVLFIRDIFQEGDETFYRGQVFLNKKSLFSVPCPSDKLGIFIISDLNATNILTITATKVERKCLKIKYTLDPVSYVIVPLLHTNN